MRVGIDGRALTGRYTGDRTYWRNLARALPALDPAVEYVVYSRIAIPPGELPEAPNLTQRVAWARSDRLWTLVTLPRALRQDAADLVHTQYTTPLDSLCPCPIVTSVHDISFHLYPQWFPMRHRLLLNLTVPASMRRAARVITLSESSRSDILRVYGLPEGKVVVTSPGVPEEFQACGQPEEGSFRESLAGQESARASAKERYGIDAPFVLAVGVLQPRKNLITLAEAFGLVQARLNLPHRLVLAGKAGWSTAQETLRQAAAKHGGEDAARALLFTGYVPDEDLPVLYHACDAFAYPSLYEGFGLPPLEAMACGAPVLVSDGPPMPEVVGDAALVVGARDVAGWANALERVLTDRDLSMDLRRRGPYRAAHFTWTECARRTLAVYREAVGSRK